MDVSIDVGGAAFTAQRYSAGGPLPTLGSTARTANTCCCSDRPWYSAGDVQAAGAAPSREHSKVAPAWSEVNSKVASGLSEGFGGSLVIVATGATATVQLRVSRPLATSGPVVVAMTVNVWLPFASSVYVICPPSQLSGAA